MAYDGALRVYQFQAPETLVSAATAGMDIGEADADLGSMICPIDFMIYQFGVHVHQTLGASAVGSVFLTRATNVAGTETTIVELDMDSTSLLSGNNTLPLITASTGSEAIIEGDTIFSPMSNFPFLVVAPQVLETRHVDSGTVVGEVTPFVIGKWQSMDGRPTSVWTDIT